MELLYLLEKIRFPFLDKLMLLITELGNETPFLVLAFIAFWCIDKYFGYYLVSVGLVGTGVNAFLKSIFRVPRPWILDPEFSVVEGSKEAATGYSFPSGHTQTACTVFGTSAMYAKRKKFTIFCIVMIALVGFSRMYLGVHTPLDVSVSLAISALLLAFFYRLIKKYEKDDKKMLYILLSFTLFFVLLLVYALLVYDEADANSASTLKNAYKLLGTAIGVLLSFIMDRKVTRFETKASFLAQIIKTALGLGIVLLLKVALKELLILVFGEVLFTTYTVRYLILVFVGCGLYPMTFKYLNKLFSKKAK
ncbi:MAG: phosphatase PAP2 family protein [Clostridia bacterium]|nr:phosphatase PAP2 family protein [Clostridia bacterium]